MNPGSFKKNTFQKRPGKKQQVTLILQEFGNIKVMSDVDMKLIDYLYSKNTYDRVEIRSYVDNIIQKSFCNNSVGRIYLTIELIKKMNYSDLLEKVLTKIKTFVQQKICTHSKKIKEIFKVLKKVKINIAELLKEMEQDFKFPSQLKLAYRMAAN